ncbi:flagellar hook-length control protein FliK [Paucibacter sp. AS339]|uniref:flagellar hook-length control protein FliK n=1 Tax=Paucibacter hankyongi TaxID=3133434 RepID=UPI0030A663A2
MTTDTNTLLAAPGRFKPIARQDRPNNGLVPAPKSGEAPAESFSQLLKSYDPAQSKQGSTSPMPTATLLAQALPRPYTATAPAAQPPVNPPSAEASAPHAPEGGKPNNGTRSQQRTEAARQEGKHAAKPRGATQELAKPAATGPKQDGNALETGEARLDDKEAPDEDVSLDDQSDQAGIRGAGRKDQASDPLNGEFAAADVAANASSAAAPPELSGADAASAGLLTSTKTGIGAENGTLDGTEDGASSQAKTAALGVAGQGARNLSKAERAEARQALPPSASADAKAQANTSDLIGTQANSGAAGAPAQRKELALAQGEGASFDKLLAANAAATNATGTDKPSSSGEKPQVMLSANLYDSAFAPEMAARLSVLAADGVQEAQLHLNPSEMGPVAVTIVLDGQQAQISFHAEQADTRNVLEQSLPDLAAALRESGLTLSGGGVFQQANGQGQGQQSRSDEGSAPRGKTLSQDTQSSLATRPAVPQRVSRGVLDMYA